MRDDDGLWHGLRAATAGLALVLAGAAPATAQKSPFRLMLDGGLQNLDPIA